MITNGGLMIRTITLLEEKNSYLEKFVGLNIMKLKKLNVGDFSDLEEFREERENILNIIKHIDMMIEARVADFTTTVIPNEYKNRTKDLLQAKDEFVHMILAQDLEIMQIIEQAKTQIIMELQTVRKNKKTIGSYKSFSKKEIIDEEF